MKFRTKLKRSTFFKLSIAISSTIILIEIIILSFSYLSRENDLIKTEAFNQKRIIEMYGESRGAILTRESIQEKLSEFTFNVTGLVAIIVLTTTVSFLYAHYLVAGRYFHQLHNFTSKFDPENKEIFPEELIPDSDIGDLFLAFNKIIVQLDEYSKKLQEEQIQNMHTEKLASLGEIAAGVAHEINNPLAINIGHLEILKLKLASIEKFDPDLAKSIESSLLKIEKASYRIVKIVKLLKPAATKDESANKIFSLNSVIEDTISFIHEAYTSENIKIHFEAYDNFEVKGSKSEMNQILVNLFSNSKDAMKTSVNKVISIKLELIESKICLKFKDSGPGIPKNLKDKIFEPFFSTKDVNEGTGLGLALVHNMVVRGMGGSISVNYEEKNGSEFIIEIPALEEITPKMAG